MIVLIGLFGVHDMIRHGTLYTGAQKLTAIASLIYHT